MGTQFNVLRIRLTDECNLRCPHCLGGDIKELGKGDVALTNEMLLPYIYKYFDPYDWMIELSGGEPTTFKGFNKLIRALSNRGFQGLIKTNGIIPVPKLDNFIRYVTWHRQVPTMPRQADVIVILQHPDDHRKNKNKIMVCQRNKFPYDVQEYIPYKATGAHLSWSEKNIYVKKISLIDPFGNSSFCDFSEEKASIERNEPPLIREICRNPCQTSYCFIYPMTRCKRGKELVLNKYNRL